MEAAENAAIDAAEAANALLLGGSPQPCSPTCGDGMLTGGEGDSSDGEDSSGQPEIPAGLVSHHASCPVSLASLISLQAW